ncbi:MAG: hypothetical protein EBX99_08425 [Acidimicrobiia bacterium]|nr:hypothetical protein [Acidimicrobiia bacterium]
MKPVILCDLDGVVWLAHRPIPGSAEAVAELRAAGHRVLFVTNNSSATIAAQENALATVGIEAHGDVVTSAMAGAHVLSPGERVLICGGPGIREAVAVVGADVVSHDDVDRGARVDTVLVGFHRDFDYEIMRRAAGAVRTGARLVGVRHHGWTWRTWRRWPASCCRKTSDRIGRVTHHRLGRISPLVTRVALPHGEESDLQEFVEEVARFGDPDGA